MMSGPVSVTGGAPLGWQPGIDWEVYSSGTGFEAVAYDEDVPVAVVRAKRRWALKWRIVFAHRRLSR